MLMFCYDTLAFDAQYVRNGIRLDYDGIDSFAPGMNFAKIEIMFMVKLIFDERFEWKITEEVSRS